LGSTPNYNVTIKGVIGQREPIQYITFEELNERLPGLLRIDMFQDRDDFQHILWPLVRVIQETARQ
jgi:hypothetical protein